MLATRGPPAIEVEEEAKALVALRSNKAVVARRCQDADSELRETLQSIAMHMIRELVALLVCSVSFTWICPDRQI